MYYNVLQGTRLARFALTVNHESCTGQGKDVLAASQESNLHLTILLLTSCAGGQ